MSSKRIFENVVGVCSRGLGLACLVLLATTTAFAQGTTFLYQGKLSDNGAQANGSYDFQFKLYDMLAGGTLQGSPTTVTVSSVQVTSGIFTVELDFGSAGFPGANRFLEIAVKPAGGPTLTMLTPRQPVTATPYSINATQLGGIAKSGFIQNGTSQQGSTSFNISGDGSAGGTLTGNTVNAATQYSINGGRVLKVDANGGTFVGLSAGQNNTTGAGNSFFGNNAGLSNSTGNNSSFFGASAGRNNTADNNSFFGSGAGFQNISGTGNSLFGFNSGTSVTTGGSNAFFGTEAGQNNVSGSGNTFVGHQAGLNNTVDSNSFFGYQAGKANTDGSQNTFVGYQAGHNNNSNFNSFVGYQAGSANMTGSINTFVGVQAGQNNTTGFGNSIFGSIAGQHNTSGGSNAFLGWSAGNSNTMGQANCFLGTGAGQNNTIGNNNTFIGTLADFSTSNPTGDSNTLLGDLTKLTSGISNATAIGANAQVQQSNSLVLGSINGINGATADTNVGIGTTTPTQRLHVVGDALVTGNLTVNGTINSSSGVLSVSAISPLFSSGGQNPSISLSGVVPNTNGGTGLSASGATGSFLRSNGMTWTSSPIQAADIPNLSVSYIQNTTSQQLSSNFNISGNGSIGGNLIANGNVGVGTASPQTTLHVKNTNIPTILEESSSTLGTWLQLMNSSTGGRTWNVISSGSGNGEGAGKLLFHDSTAAVTRMFIDASGNVRWANSMLASNQGGSLELGGDNSTAGVGTPFIDFHLGGQPTQDFNVRLWNDTNGRLSVEGNLRTSGTIEVDTLGTSNTSTQLCRNTSSQISLCSSSLRYKTNIAPFAGGLEIINRLRPISFTWKQGGARDVGLGAEEVERVEPLLTFRNDKGDIEGVRYNQLNVVLVNAIKQQQQQIKLLQGHLDQQQQQITAQRSRFEQQQHRLAQQVRNQQTQLEQQQTQLESLKKLVCLKHPNAKTCR